MEMEHVVMIAVGLIAAVGGWISNHISNKPKKEDVNVNRIETIMRSLERQYERSEKRVEECEDRYSKACEENRQLREKLRDLRRVLSKLQEGGE